jgi:hypothetical protein
VSYCGSVDDGGGLLLPRSTQHPLHMEVTHFWSEIAPKLQTLALCLNFHLNILYISFSCGALASVSASASASLSGFDSTFNAYLLHRWLVESSRVLLLFISFDWIISLHTWECYFIRN